MTRRYFQSVQNLKLLCLILAVLAVSTGWFFWSRPADASQPTLRGSIYDRSGRELAVSHAAKSLYANPRELQDPDGLANRLAPLLNTPVDTLRIRLKAPGSFVWLKRSLEPAEYSRVAEFVRQEKVRGLDFIAESRRVYPQDQLAAHVLGFVGTEDKGLAGIELSMDAVLKGRSLYLTLDSELQAAVERSLDEALARTEARSVSMIVMNPQTGEVLAMASRPAFNPNAFFRYPEQVWRNPAIATIPLTAGNNEWLQSHAEALGFGKPTGIELPGEEAGSVPVLAVTPLQLLSAVSALANSGDLLKPRIIKASPPQLVRQAVSPELAQQLATVAGYRFAGQTGSAGSAGDDGSDADSCRAVDSYAGFWPLAEGQLTGLAVVDGRCGLPQGGVDAASIFNAAMAKVGQAAKLTPGR